MTHEAASLTSNTTHSHAATLFLQILSGDPSSNVASGLQSAGVRNETSQVTRLIQCGQTIERLKDSSWYTSLPTQWVEHLDPTTFAALLLRLYENASTGILIARNRHEQSKTVALVGGTPVAVANHNLDEKLGAFLVRSGHITLDGLEKAARIMLSDERPLGWALLNLGLLSAGDLLRAQQSHAEQSLMALLAWVDGDIEFREAGQAVDLHRVIDTPFVAFLRQAYAHVYRQDAATLASFTAPFFARTDSLSWRDVPERFMPLVEGAHPTLVDHARRGASPAALGAAIRPHDAAQYTRDLADIYVLTHFGILGFAAAPKVIRLANLPVSFHTHEVQSAPTVDPLAAYRQRKEQMTAAKRALNAFNPQEAIAKLSAILAEPGEAPLEAQAYLAIAYALTGEKDRSMEQALRALKRQPQDALAHAAMSRAFEAAGNSSQAAYHQKTALGLSQNNPEWYAEINAALKLAARPQDRKTSQRSEGVALALYIGVVVLLLGIFAAANVFRLGLREYLYEPDDTFFFVRRLTLLVGGLLGMFLWAAKMPIALFRELPWKITWTSTWRILLYGSIVGLCSPMQRVTGPVAAVIILSVIHAVAEEIFFRGFLTRMLLDVNSDRRLAILVSAMIYGVYHITYWSFWAESSWQARSLYIGLIMAFAGVPYAWLYQRTRTLTAPILCHVAVQVVMMIFSLVRRH